MYVTGQKYQGFTISGYISQSLIGEIRCIINSSFFNLCVIRVENEREREIEIYLKRIGSCRG